MWLLPRLKKYLSNFQGFSVVELLVALGVIVLILGGSTLLIFASRDLENLNLDYLKALNYVQEGLEAVRAIRDGGWDNLSPGTFGLSSETGAWILSGSEDTLEDRFTRTVTLNSLGADKYEAVCQVNWQSKRGAENSLSFSTYLTNWREPQTSEGGGIIDLGDEGNDVYLQGTYAYLVLARPHDSLAVIDVSNPSSPSVVGTADIGGEGEDVFVLGNYAYIPTNTNKVAILDISNPQLPEQVSLINLSAQPTSIFVKDGYAYIGQAKKNEGLVIYNVANPQTPVFYRSYNIGREVYDVMVQGSWIYMAVNLGRGLDIEGDYGYVAVDAENRGLEIYYLGWAPWLINIGSIDVGGRGSNVDAFGGYAYVAVKNTEGGLVKVDVDPPIDAGVVGTSDIEGGGNDVFYQDGYAYMAVENVNGGFAVVSLSE